MASTKSSTTNFRYNHSDKGKARVRRYEESPQRKYRKARLLLIYQMLKKRQRIEELERILSNAKEV